MKNQLDLAKLSIEELLELNRQVVDRVRYLRQKQSYQALAKFNVGDRISFKTDRGIIEGTIVRLNKKTASIHTDDHHHWNVSPQVLKKVTQKNTEEKLTNLSNLFTLRPS